jgi:hypothetical protein
MMYYKKNPLMNRRYLYPPRLGFIRPPRSRAHAQKEDMTEKIQTVEEIPLPNISETETENNAPLDLSRSQHFLKRSKRPSILDFLKERISIEELLLVGLIFLLFDEALDDELLLILLVYIFLT